MLHVPSAFSVMTFFHCNFDYSHDYSYLTGFVQVMENLESHGISEGHGKSWKSNTFLKNKNAKERELKKITDKTETGFNFNRNRHKHTFYILLIMLENMLNVQ